MESHNGKKSSNMYITSTRNTCWASCQILACLHIHKLDVPISITVNSQPPWCHQQSSYILNLATHLWDVTYFFYCRRNVIKKTNGKKKILSRHLCFPFSFCISCRFLYFESQSQRNHTVLLLPLMCRAVWRLHVKYLDTFIPCACTSCIFSLLWSWLCYRWEIKTYESTAYWAINTHGKYTLVYVDREGFSCHLTPGLSWQASKQVADLKEGNFSCYEHYKTLCDFNVVLLENISPPSQKINQKTFRKMLCALVCLFLKFNVWILQDVNLKTHF